MNNEEAKVTTEETNEQKPKRDYKIFVIIFVVVLVTHFVRTGGCGKENDNLPTAEELEQADGFTAEDGPIITEDGLIITPTSQPTNEETGAEDGVMLEFVYEDDLEEAPEAPVNTTVNPRLVELVDYNADAPKVAGDAEIDEKELYANILQPNTVLPEEWGGIDYQCAYSGLFARYCELAFNNPRQDPTVYSFAYGDMDGDGVYEVIIQRPNSDSDSYDSPYSDPMNWDVYKLSTTTNNGLYYPMYVGTLDNLINPSFYHAVYSARHTLYTIDYVGTSEYDETINKVEISRSNIKDYVLSTEHVYSGKDCTVEYSNSTDVYMFEFWYGSIADGIEYPSEY